MIPRLIFRLIKHRIKWILIVFILRLFCVSADVSRGNPGFEMIQICKKQIINILSNDDSFLPQITPSAALPKQRLQATIGPLDSKTDTSQTNP